MHRIGILLAVVALAVFASDVYSFPGGKGKGKSAQGQGGQGGPPSPAAMAARMIQKFDRDGDKALNEQELTAAFTAMRQMRAHGGKPGQGGGKGNFGGKAAGKGKGKGAGGKSKKGQQ